MAEVKLLEENQYEAWDEFVRAHPEGTFFHLTGWKKVIEKTFGHQSFYFYVVEGPEIRGILPLFLIKSPLFGRFLVSVAFATYGGLLAEDEIAAAGLLASAQRLTERLGLDYLELRNLYRQEKGWPTKDLYYTFRKEILPEEEANLKAVPRKQRRMIRVARDKYKLKSVIGRYELLDTMYEIYARSVHSLGSPVYPKSLFRNLLDEFPEANILIVYSPEGQPLAGVLSFYYKDEVLPYYGGSVREGKRLAANDFMYWELMRYACQRGYKIFDFGRSKKGTGPFSFKKHWGFEPKPLYYQYYLCKTKEMPNLSPVNPKFQMFIKLWQRMPFGLTKIIGPKIVKYIP